MAKQSKNKQNKINENRQPDFGMNRKDFLKFGALSGLFVGTAGLAGCAPETEATTTNISAGSSASYAGKAKYVIFLVSDGMSHGTLQMADMMRRRQYGKASKWISLYEENKVARGLMDMETGNSTVPDSAAVSSSWGSGKRIYNGNVNMDNDGTEYRPILPLFKEAGRKTALVSSARITHATPAGFAANVAQRGMEDLIAEQYLQREIDIILGGGNRFFDGSSRDDGRNLYAEFNEKGYKVARTKAELGEASEFERTLGIFTDSHLPYMLDHQNTPQLRRDVPTLAEMSRYAINSLEASGEGFILQIEGARVDHAAHSADAAGLIYDQLAFDEAIEVAMEFYDRHPEETQIIIASDHGNANPGLNGAGQYYNDSLPNFDKIQEFRYTNNWILRGLDDGSSVNQIMARVEEATRLEIDREHARMLQQSLRGEFSSPYAMRGRPSMVLCDIMSNHTSVAFLGTAHTTDYVELAVLGVGQEQIGSLTRNTDLFTLMTQAAGVEVPQAQMAG
ncbi:MAG: alkaline phosphatase [Cyclonatronaceae bacterium]